MKKKKIMSIALAAILVLAFAAAGFAADVPINVEIDNSKPNPRDTITVKVSCTANDVGGFEGKISTKGLEYVGTTGKPLSDETQLTVMGTGSVTYTYKVTAKAGDTINFSLSGVKVANEAGTDWHNPVGNFAVSGTVAAAVEPDPEPSTPVTPDPEPSTPVNPDPQPSTNPETPSEGGSTGDTAKDSALDDVPKTGDATTDMWVFAVIALAAAGTIGIAAYRKAFSK